MVNYIYLGYGTTDSNGVAKLDHDANGDPISHSYTGTGAGKVDIVASLDNPIGEGSIQSETCELLDCLFYDDGVSENNQYYNASNRVSESHDTTGKTLSNTSGSTGTYYLVAPPTTPSSASSSSFNTGYNIELTLISYTGNSYIHVTDGTVTFFRSWSNLNCTGGEHIRIEITSNTQKIYVDDELAYSTTNTLADTTSIRWNLANNTNLKFKDLKVYPV